MASFLDTELKKINNILTIYEWGQKLLISKMHVIFDSIKHFHDYNPIEHIKTRIKTADSIAKKLNMLHLEITAENARKKLTDIAGIRIICSFAKDIHYLVDILKSIPDMQVTTEKDYVNYPKKSGYRSYHVIIEVPVFHSGRTEIVPIEVQLRTAAMDFWATLEHKVRYKYKDHIPQHLSDELIVCAEKIAELDNRMFLIHDIISLINEHEIVERLPLTPIR